MNSDLNQRLAGLSPAQRQLLDLRLRKKRAAGSTEQTITRRPNPSSAELSIVQERLWFLDQFDSDRFVYNRCPAWRFFGPLQQDLLARSLTEIIRRHEILRTAIRTVAGRAVPAILPAQPIKLNVIDLEDANDAERESEARRVVVAEARRPFDLAEAPLLRATLVRLSPDDQILILAIHHIVSDGWSDGVFWRELSSLYPAFAQGQPSPLPELPIQYADFAHWQRNRMQGEVLERTLNYWKKKLGDAPPFLELPTDRPRPKIHTSNGSCAPLRLNAALTEALKSLSRQEGVTLFMTLLAAFKTLLSRYTGQEDVLVGSPISGRGAPQLSDLIGFFVTTLVLRTDLSGNPTFREVLARVRQVALEAYAHQDAPFEQLAIELQPKRDLSRTPLFQVMFNFRNFHQVLSEIPGLGAEHFGFDRDFAQFDFELDLEEKDGGLSCLAIYNTDLFDPETIQRLLQNFATLLESIVANPVQPIHRLQLLTNPERDRLVGKWSGAEALQTRSSICLHALFEEQVERTPEAIAVVFEREQLAYRSLNAKSNQLARHLRQVGVRAESRIGICMERSVEMIVALLGVWKAGACFVPLDPSHPKDRLRFSITDAGISILLTQEKLKPQLENLKPALSISGEAEKSPSLPPLLICLDADWGAIQSESDLNLTRNVTSQNLAYIIYTSGSTGQPKGVMITHEALVNYTHSAIAAYEIQPTDRILQFASLCFDASAEEIYPCLSRGATLVLRSEAMVESAESFLCKCEAWDLSVVSLPTAYWHHLTAEMEKANLQMPASLRLVIIGGERAFSERLTSWLKRVSPSVRLVNTYGPTEATVVATLWTAPTLQESIRVMAEVPIGLPLPHVEAYVLDPNLQPVPVGVVGELHLGGSSLARGYLNRPDLTAQKFVPNPFHSDAASRLYKTGDWVRCLPDGNFVFVGRNDHQIKLRGYRIELGEIEAALRQHAAVGDAVVLARQDQAGEKRLVAYIVGLDEQSPGFGELRSFLQGLLPEYSIPAAFVRLAALPLTPSNKVDRRSLPAPECFEVEPTASYVAPSTPIEKRLADIWCELLAVQQVGIHDNFFDLGGHSLIATQVISRVRGTFRINLTVRSLFESPTIAKLAPVIAQSQPRAEEEEAPASIPLDPAEALTKLDNLSEEMADEAKASKFEQQIEELSPEKRALLEKWILENSAAATEAQIIPRRTSSGPCALSFAQQRLWFLAQLEPDSPLYNIARAIRIRGALSRAALQQALNGVVGRHQALRSTFDVVAGNPIQVIGDVRLLELPVLDLRAMAAAKREGEIQRLSEEEARRVFNLSKDLMIRTLLLRVRDEEHVLLLTVHHIASDGWSMEILFREIASFYEDFCVGRPFRLPELPIQYADYALWQKQRLESEVLASQLVYWKNQLKHLAPVLELPADRPRPALQTHRGARQSFRLPRNLSEGVRALSLREGATLYMTMLAAFQTLLHRYTGMDDIVVGSPIAGRDRIETEGLIGFFVNTLVLRTDLSGDPSFRELLGRVREVALGAYAHQELPFEKLVEELQPERNLSHNPLFQVLFVMQNTPREKLELAGLSLASLEVERKTAKFDLSLSIRDTTNKEQELAGSLEYNTDLFEGTTARRMCGHFQALLEGIVADPEQSLSTLPLMTQSERLQMVEECNDTQANYTRDLCIHQLFESQVQRTPEAIAVVYDGQQLTYGELNVRANQLAHLLKRMGVGPEILVGLFLERSLDMVVALLAVLKAGGAYVPMDTTYPADRLAYMLVDANPKVLITQKTLEHRIPEFKASMIFLGSGSRCLPADSSGNPRNENAPDDLAYVIYTSGSTGWPRGVAMTHHALVNLIVWQCGVSNLKDSSRTLQFSSLSFDVSFQEIFSTWCSGGSLVLIQEETRRDPIALLHFLQKERINRLFLPFVALQLLADAAASTEMIPSTLMEVYTAGEQLLITPRILGLFEKLPECSLHNQYGPSESHVVTAYRLPALRNQWGPRPPIGRPIANTQVYVLDLHQQPVPIGVPGELYIGGAGLAKGYLNQPELTAERFLRNPFSQAPGSRVFRTGDLVRYRVDGLIEFLGRFDHQVKLRGFRIELGEIESVLGGHPAVGQVIVILREDDPGDQRLVAYVVCDEGRSCQTGELKSFLGEKLPDYMIPSGFVFLEALPLTPSGKVDRKSLPPPLRGSLDSDADYVAPRDPIEQAVARIWGEVLKLERISMVDNFFALGGHSLLATQIMSRIRSTFRIDLPLRRLFEAPTVERLSQAVIAAERSAGQAERIARIVMNITVMSNDEAKNALEKKRGPKDQKHL